MVIIFEITFHKVAVPVRGYGHRTAAKTNFTVFNIVVGVIGACKSAVVGIQSAWTKGAAVAWLNNIGADTIRSGGVDKDSTVGLVRNMGSAELRVAVGEGDIGLVCLNAQLCKDFPQRLDGAGVKGDFVVLGDGRIVTVIPEKCVLRICCPLELVLLT